MKTLSLGQAAAYLGRHPQTLQRWDREGVLVPASRTPTNRRVYTEQQLEAFMGLQGDLAVEAGVLNRLDALERRVALLENT